MDFDFDEKKTRPLWKTILIEVIVWGISIAASIYMAYFITYHTLEKTNVYDDSMNETLAVDDSILINKFSYILGEPKRFDIIVFNQETTSDQYYNIKRIIGLPGEKVTIKDGLIYINDEMLSETTNVPAMTNGGLAKNGITLGDDEYFVLGDNRNGCEDSRFATIGLIKKEDIIGKAWIRLNSLSIISELNQVEEES